MEKGSRVMTKKISIHIIIMGYDFFGGIKKEGNIRLIGNNHQTHSILSNLFPISGYALDELLNLLNFHYPPFDT